MKGCITIKQIVALPVLVVGLGWGAIANAGAGLGITVGNGPDSYSSRSVALSLWNGDGSLSAGLSRRESDSGGSSANDAEENHAMLGLQFESGVGLGGSYTSNDEPTLEIETVGAGISLPLDRAQSARLFLDYRIATYTGKGVLRRQIERSEYAIGLTHALSDRFTIGGSYSDYSYNRETAPLTTLFQQRRQLNLAATSVLLDMLDYAWTLNADWRMTESQTLGFFYSRAYNLFDDASHVTTVSDRLRLWEQWSLELSATQVQESGSTLRDNYYDMALHYSFD